MIESFPFCPVQVGNQPETFIVGAPLGIPGVTRPLAAGATVPDEDLGDDPPFVLQAVVNRIVAMIDKAVYFMGKRTFKTNSTIFNISNVLMFPSLASRRFVQEL